MNTSPTILFDLDGTLLDTAPDLAEALNQLRRTRGLNDLPVSAIRSIANLGSPALLALGLSDQEADFMAFRDAFLKLYAENIANKTTFFPEVEILLNHLDEKGMRWGIVTNKPAKLTADLLSALSFDHRPACVVAGDTLPKAKPHPDPILHACKLMNVRPESCFYVGDAKTDVEASKAANMRSLVALYGYIGEGENPFHWQADGYLSSPLDLINWLSR